VLQERRLQLGNIDIVSAEIGEQGDHA
jgi:hypothetical protein